MTGLEPKGSSRNSAGPPPISAAALKTDHETAAALDRKLAGIDINLLVSLEALLICRNVTHAARRIGQTQPAMSRALGRLRDLLGDDILVRSSTGLRLTARGEHLAQIVPPTMSNLRDLLSSRQSEPSIRLSINAHLMPALLPHFLRSSDHGNEVLRVSTHKSCEEGLNQLRTRTVQYMLGAAENTGEDIDKEIVFREDFVTLVAFERHSLGGARPTPEAFLDLTHVSLVEDGAPVFPQLAEAMTRSGIRSAQLFEVPDVTSAALMVSESKLALTVPRSIAGWLTRTLPLSALLPPIDIPSQEVCMCWLAQDQDDQDVRRVVDCIGSSAREACALDQAQVRTVRSLSGRE
ncbi:LysR family transcriptional regulator [Agrobacterium vitis]|uniref:LysR family transcriptional regulator n=1 Tax=Agrobacterium vitis TaxID=373 RepID=UPI0015718C59|nr:LysR family transcriptional regulator [Agrobacterium vitis]NSZ19482.1 LysR family transcriptional regulator [Agrobacterium vitis]QZO06796.1 LysR family transcriptional regulator [Agrobacterium vitis]UJL91528.1 LysR family transcriptional regulator [Agrobacterium vitis]